MCLYVYSGAQFISTFDEIYSLFFFSPFGLLSGGRHGKRVRAAGGTPCLDRLLFHHRVRPKVAVIAEGRHGRLHLLSAFTCGRCAGREMRAKRQGLDIASKAVLMHSNIVYFRYQCIEILFPSLSQQSLSKHRIIRHRNITASK